jgi:hypothetical protein
VFSWDAEVVDYQLPRGSRVRVIDAASSSPFGPGSELSWEFSAIDGRTRFTWIWKYEPSGFIARIVDMLGRRTMTHRAIKRSLANLKTMIEERGAT